MTGRIVGSRGIIPIYRPARVAPNPYILPAGAPPVRAERIQDTPRLANAGDIAPNSPASELAAATRIP
jgi:hypothetical protein